MTRPLGNYSTDTVKSVEKYCYSVQEHILAEVNHIVEQELKKCSDHPSVYELQLFVHALRKELSKIALV